MSVSQPRIRVVLPLYLDELTSNVLRNSFAHLCTIAQNAETSKMNLRNLGIVFSPTLAIPAPLFTLFLSEFDVSPFRCPLHRSLPSSLTDRLARSPAARLRRRSRDGRGETDHARRRRGRLVPRSGGGFLLLHFEHDEQRRATSGAPQFADL